jgi:hypothetical protein
MHRSRPEGKMAEEAGWISYRAKLGLGPWPMKIGKRFFIYSSLFRN